MNDTLALKLETALRAHADLSDGSHDLSHLRRVKRIALQIAARERRGDHDILIAAAYLHDLVN
ncbi:HD domain-containing protein, partial [Tabrizicola sp.]|uniref:HD domain-containing protein n=1 Tax=Tabrizicola sp. TaxID=2005166 RepID=UPI003F39FDD9